MKSKIFPLRLQTGFCLVAKSLTASDAARRGGLWNRGFLLWAWTNHSRGCDISQTSTPPCARGAPCLGANLLFCAAKRSGAFHQNTPAGAEGPCVTCRRFHEAVLRVIVSPPAGAAPALCHHGRSGYQPPLLVPNLYGVVVCTALR